MSKSGQYIQNIKCKITGISKLTGIGQFVKKNIYCNNQKYGYHLYFDLTPLEKNDLIYVKVFPKSRIIIDLKK